ncbi:hypothetical protein [Ilyomonas limi]|uniref:hypothetical protein n=1 Tax=Ilyomonas limi TaxID=2575867 RepID=UPI001484CF0E|nr:hypothetical protein [Ilyomonas limi]
MSTNVEGLKLAGQGWINQKRGTFSDFYPKKSEKRGGNRKMKAVGSRMKGFRTLLNKQP